MAEFNNGQKYRCRVMPGCTWDRSVQKRTPFFRIVLEVAGGDMEGQRLVREVYFSGRDQNGGAKTDEDMAKMVNAVRNEFQSAFGIDITAVDLRKLNEHVDYKECAVQAEVKVDKKGQANARASRLMSVKEMEVGGIETEVAQLIGNKATAASEGFDDRY